MLLGRYRVELNSEGARRRGEREVQYTHSSARSGNKALTRALRDQLVSDSYWLCSSLLLSSLRHLSALTQHTPVGHSAPRLPCSLRDHFVLLNKHTIVHSQAPPHSTTLHLSSSPPFQMVHTLLANIVAKEGKRDAIVQEIKKLADWCKEVSVYVCVGTGCFNVLRVTI